MRTYTLSSVDAKIENIDQFLVRAANKRVERERLVEIRADLLSPEKAQKNVDRLDSMKADIARLEASIARAAEEKEHRENLETAFPDNGLKVVESETGHVHFETKND